MTDDRDGAGAAGRTAGSTGGTECAAAPAEPEGGEAACWLNRVCPECGGLLDGAPPAVCGRCGAEVAEPHV